MFGYSKADINWVERLEWKMERGSVSDVVEYCQKSHQASLSTPPKSRSDTWGSVQKQTINNEWLSIN